MSADHKFPPLGSGHHSVAAYSHGCSHSCIRSLVAYRIRTASAVLRCRLLACKFCTSEVGGWLQPGNGKPLPEPHYHVVVVARLFLDYSAGVLKEKLIKCRTVLGFCGFVRDLEERCWGFKSFVFLLPSPPILLSSFSWRYRIAKSSVVLFCFLSDLWLFDLGSGH